MRKFQILILVTALSALACGSEPARPRIRTSLSPERFAAVLAQLESAHPAQRAKILAKHGTNERELRAFVKAYAADPAALSAVFDSAQALIEIHRAYPE